MRSMPWSQWHEGAQAAYDEVIRILRIELALSDDRALRAALDDIIEKVNVRMVKDCGC